MGVTFCVYGKDTLYIVRVLGKERCQETWRVGKEMCACLRDKVIRDLYWGPDFRREGVLMCSCVHVQGRERLVWGGDRGVALDKE